MANFKKGIALALVATTAFTFAPVSTLGTPNAVVAQAAVTPVAVTLTSANPTDANQKLKNISADDIVVLKIAKQDKVSGLKVSVANATDATVPAGSVSQAITKKTNDIVGNSSSFAPSATDDTFNAIKFTGGTEEAPIEFDAANANGYGTVSVTAYLVSMGEDAEGHPVALSYSELASYNVTRKSKAVVELASKDGDTDKPEYVTEKVISGVGKAVEVTNNASWELHVNTETLKQDDGEAGTVKKVEYSSDSASVTLTAKADNNAIAKATAVGTANVTAKVTMTDGTVASKTIKYVVNKSAEGNISRITYAYPGKSKLQIAKGGVNNPNTEEAAPNTLELTQAVKTVKLNTTAAGTVSYKSSDTAVATVDANGNVTFVKAGTATIYVEAEATSDYKLDHVGITVVCTTAGTDVITSKVNGETVDNDKNPISVDNVVKSATIVPTSIVGNTDFTFGLYTDANANSPSASNDSVLTIDSKTGVLTVGTATDDVKTYYVKVSTKDANGIKGGEQIIKVNVYKLPEDIITADDIVLDLGENITKTIEAKAGNANAVFAYQETPDATTDVAAGNIIALSGNKVTALKYGTTRVTITEPATATTRATSKKITVSVVKEATKKVSDLSVANTSVVAKVGETVELGAKATNPVTYTVADPSVATVSETGVVTAVKAGMTTVTVSAAESNAMNAGTITVPVVVTEDAKPVVIAKPAKVKSVTAKAVKGGKVKFTAKKVANAAGYQFVYTVGKKTVKKTTTKTALTVKIGKGKKATVKVRAYNYKNGTAKQYGAFSAKKTVKASK